MKSFLVAVTLLAALAAPVYALEFSADVVTEAKGQRMDGRIYVADKKVRMDMAGTSTITRMDKNVTWLLMPQQPLYMEQPIDPARIAGATEKMPGEVSRTPLGTDLVDGRPADKFRITYTGPGGEASVDQWVDKATGIPVKTVAIDGSWTMEYRNLNAGPQDPSLFEIPAGYKKFSMPTMADMMRAAGQRGQ